MDEPIKPPPIVVKTSRPPATLREEGVDNYAKVSFVLACCATGFLVPGAWGFIQVVAGWLYRPGWGSVLLVLPAIPVAAAGIGAAICSRTSKSLAIFNVAILGAAVAYMVWIDAAIKW